MNKLLTNTLESIKKERGKFDKSFDLVDDLLRELGEEDLASKLYSEIDMMVEWEVVADLYGILVWSTSDNGRELTNTTERWITECDNERKILIALNLDVFPFLDSEEMRSKLEKVAIKYPSLKTQCNSLIAARAKQNA